VNAGAENGEVVARVDDPSVDGRLLPGANPHWPASDAEREEDEQRESRNTHHGNPEQDGRSIEPLEARTEN